MGRGGTRPYRVWEENTLLAREFVSLAGHARHFTATNKTTKESK
jgi:hypothetical protein